MWIGDRQVAVDPELLAECRMQRELRLGDVPPVRSPPNAWLSLGK
jgi:hypothetical protein